MMEGGVFLPFPAPIFLVPQCPLSGCLLSFEGSKTEKYGQNAQFFTKNCPSAKNNT